jgi:hypothetical protein
MNSTIWISFFSYFNRRTEEILYKKEILIIFQNYWGNEVYLGEYFKFKGDFWKYDSST